MDSILRKLMSPRGLLAMLAVALIIIGLLQIDWDDEVKPCEASQFPRACFTMSEATCQKAWPLFVKECKNTIQQLNLGDGRLISPILRRCQELKYLRAFASMYLTDSACQERKKDLEIWAKSNPDF